MPLAIRIQSSCWNLKKLSALSSQPTARRDLRHSARETSSTTDNFRQGKLSLGLAFQLLTYKLQNYQFFEELSIFPTATLRSVILKSVIQERQNSGRQLRQRQMRQVVESLIGAVLCGIAAIGMTVVAIGRSWEASVPLIFVAILLGISAIFGARAGILGSILAGAIFAAFLFQPSGSIHVNSDAARTNLAWMLMLGISFSFLFAPSSRLRRR